MTVLNLVHEDDPILHTKLEKFDFSNPPVNPVELYRDLCDTMIHYNGIGLAANQCGLPYRVFILRSEKIICCFNPIIVNYDPEELLLKEGCLTFPGLELPIKRSRAIRIRYTQPDGNVKTDNWIGMTARIAQHEFDHLEGIDFRKRASYFHLKQAKNKQKKLLKNLEVQKKNELKKDMKEVFQW